MSGGTPSQDQRSGEHPQPHEDRSRSGEGASTALEALIRQRRLAEGPEQAADPIPPG